MAWWGHVITIDQLWTRFGCGYFVGGVGGRYRHGAYGGDAGEHVAYARYRFGVCGGVVGVAIGGVGGDVLVGDRNLFDCANSGGREKYWT